MSRSCRPYKPPLALATLNAASIPSFIFWPSSLAGPVNGAEIPNRISLSVTPRTSLLTLLSCTSGFEIAVSAACCPWAREGGTCCACAVAAGGAAAIAETSALFAGASFALCRSDGLASCLVCESETRKLARSNSGFAKTTNNATTADSTATRAVWPTHPSNPSSRCAGGSGTGLGHRGVIGRFLSPSSNEGTVDVEVLTCRNCPALGVAGCSRDHLGAYFLSSGSVLSSPKVLMTNPLTRVSSDQIHLSFWLAAS